jgi:murein DD-endopeptidase MepM/ murein hydrolase activator NlpD
VTQGACLGAVGATGLATAPHLDYRMLRDGRFVNPLRVQTPRAEPLQADEMPAFDQAASQALAFLDGIPHAAAARLASTEPRAPDPPQRN